MKSNEQSKDQEYLRKVRSLPCYSCGGLDECAMVRHAHHHTHGRALSKKSSDYDTMPLCPCCHANFHSHIDRFTGWDKARRRAFQDAGVKATRDLLLDEEVF